MSQILRNAGGDATVRVGDVHVASISQAAEGEKPRWLPTVSVEESAIAKVGEAGGTAAQLSDATWHVTDPDGGELLLSQLLPERHQPLHDAQPPPGHLNWGDVLASDGREDALAAFYT